MGAAVGIAADWQPLVGRFLASPRGLELVRFIKGRQSQGVEVYPPNPFRMLELTPLERVKVVVLGQDPYHGPGQAEGLAFSVASGVRVPPSLRNIHKEVRRDVGEGALAPAGSLVSWARQGVLLLNTCLTVEQGCPGSHAKRGWEMLTHDLLDACSRHPTPKVFMLWGAHAQSLRPGIDERRHLVLTANHPSPLSASRGPVPFLGCGHFSAANRWLRQNLSAEVDWLANS